MARPIEDWQPIYPGLRVPGNIDLANRPRVRNADSSISTVRSLGVNVDGKEVLIPTVSEDGRIMTDREAIDTYRKTGRHLGIFDTPAHSTAYAQQLHQDQAAMLDKPKGGTGQPIEDWQPIKVPAGAQVTETPWYDRPIGSMASNILDPGGYWMGPQGKLAGMGPSVSEALGTLPTLGAATGALVGEGGGTIAGFGFGGVPGAVAGAGFGGATGEAARQHAMRLIGAPAPSTPQAAAKDIGTEAATQAAAELGGQGLRAVGRATGTGMIDAAVRPPISLRQEFPNVIDTIVKERLPVGAGIRGGEKGSERAAVRLAEESRGVRKLLRKATIQGKTFEASKIAEPVLKLLDDIAEQPLSKAEMASLDGMLTEFLDTKKGPLNPVDVLKLKQRAQAIAKPIYRAVARGENVSADQSVKARFNSAIATGAKSELETIGGVAEGEAKKQSLIGAKKALSRAEARQMGYVAEAIPAAAGFVSSMLGPNSNLEDGLKRGILAYAAFRFHLSPRVLSREGKILTSAQAQELMHQFPRLGAAYLSEARARAEREAKPQ